MVKQLYERGFGREDALQLFRFIDWVRALPAGLDRRFLSELQEWEKTGKMPYITSVERIGIEKGIQQGMQQDEAALLVRLLERRFGPLPGWACERIEQAEQALSEEWGLRLLEAGSLEEVFRK